ncbi:MAG: hypothetical protein QM734_02165 [Cyclobacteriaceae bacterium]
MEHQWIFAGFAALTIGSYFFLFNEFKKAAALTNWVESKRKKFLSILALSLIGWIVFVSIWSLSGRIGNFSIFPLNLIPILAIPLITIIAFTFSKTAKEILVRIPTQNILRLQSFRFFVELLLFALFVENVAPIQMTFDGRNFDVISGITAPIIAFLYTKGKISKFILVVWNLTCLALLINIVAIAILSMPTPLRVFMNEPSNTIVTVFPVSWLPGLLVPLAYGLHFLSLRQLSLKN